MRRFSIRTIFIACVACALLLAYFRDPLIKFVRNGADGSPYQLIETERDMEAMLASPRAIVFVNADWSISSKVARRSLDDFARDWQWFDRKPGVSFYMFDITHQNQLLMDWSKTDNRLRLIIGGNGDAVWMQDGSVQHVFNPRMETTPEELADLTIVVFEK